MKWITGNTYIFRQSIPSLDSQFSDSWEVKFRASLLPCLWFLLLVIVLFHVAIHSVCTWHVLGKKGKISLNSPHIKGKSVKIINIIRLLPTLFGRGRGEGGSGLFSAILSCGVYPPTGKLYLLNAKKKKSIHRILWIHHSWLHMIECGSLFELYPTHPKLNTPPPLVLKLFHLLVCTVRRRGILYKSLKHAELFA